ncbi:hypothetical protein GCM10022415_25000 [Knoellia locipacati]|uniref:Uncharacterized protein n=1 Tax=Knoellia locipacati TaxID=882824 RepID=A0A512T2K7_9MICO|nr:hypothetical protein KLO01_24960 [Knoellia locipacati]
MDWSWVRWAWVFVTEMSGLAATAVTLRGSAEALAATRPVRPKARAASGAVREVELTIWGSFRFGTTVWAGAP